MSDAVVNIGFVASGWGSVGLPGWSAGYVYLPALAGVAIASVLLAPLGAAAAHRLPTRRLKQIFVLLLSVLVLRLLLKLW